MAFGRPKIALELSDEGAASAVRDGELANSSAFPRGPRQGGAMVRER